jgi:hypothetical protein
MATLQTVNLGSVPNDPSADTFRAAFQKVMNNETVIYNALSDVNDSAATILAAKDVAVAASVEAQEAATASEAARDDIIAQVGTGANQLVRLDSNGDLVGPISIRGMLSSSNVVPSLLEHCVIVDSLTNPTTFEYRLGDGVTVRGLPTAILIKSGTAYIGANLTGNSRGTNSLDIQSTRSTLDYVASGPSAIALGRNVKAHITQSVTIGADCFTFGADGFGNVTIGNSCTNSGYYSAAVGYACSVDWEEATTNSSSAFGAYSQAKKGSATFGNSCFALGLISASFGIGCQATGAGSSAFGISCQATGAGSSAFGISCQATGAGSSAFGRGAISTVADTLEIAADSDNSVRRGAIRIHGATGMVGLTLQNRSTEYADGGTSIGQEADNTLMREAYSIRRNGDIILLDVNIGGTVKNITLGTAT